MKNNPFIWDKYSDQPYPIKDKLYKKYMRKKNIFDYVYLILTNLILFPLSIALMPFFKSKDKVNNKTFYSMGLDLHKGDIQKELIDELGVKSVLIRLPLWEMNNINKYLEFVKLFTNDDIEVILNIMQDRENIDNNELLETNIKMLFKTFSPYVNEYQIGTTINRTKWGFFSMKEYMLWYEKIQKIRDSSFIDLKLIGSSVIDFEFHYTIRTLFNFINIKYDKFSALLYVDRRGDPSNTQMIIFDTKRKIDMLFSLVNLSSKTTDEIYITEVNWPLSNTAPYAPTSEAECVSEEDYSKYMVKYYKIAKENSKIQRIYWHALIAPGYGLVDNRDGKIRKTKAFYAFKEMINNSNLTS